MKENSSTKALFLKLGKREFLEHGFKGTSLRKIVSEAGFTLGFSTDTQDTTGTVLETHPVTVGADEVRDILLRTDVNTLTPLEAMNLLFELQKKARA